MKRRVLFATLCVVLFLGGAAFHYALAASPAVMDEPLVVTKGMWVNLVIGVLQPRSGTIQYAFDPTTNALTGRVHSSAPTTIATCDETLARIKALIAPAFPAAQTKTISDPPKAR